MSKTWKPCVIELDDGTFIATIEKKSFLETQRRYVIRRSYSKQIDFMYFAANADTFPSLDQAMALAVQGAAKKNREDYLYSVVKIHYPALDPNKTL